jgi:hypothetical protein
MFSFTYDFWFQFNSLLLQHLIFDINSSVWSYERHFGMANSRPGKILQIYRHRLLSQLRIRLCFFFFILISFYIFQNKKN